MKAMLVIVALCAPLAAHAVYKCKGPDGRVLYSDLPCPAAEQRAKVAAAPLAALLERDPPGAGRMSVPRVDFGQGADNRLANVVALLDSMALDGNTCEAALKANDRKVAPCLPFVTALQPGREWSQTLYELHGLLKEPGLFERRRADFAKASALVARISGHSQFVERRLGAQ